jgi:spoIIIJ-associated protein
MFSKKAKIKASLLSLNIDFSFADNPETKSPSKMKIESRVKPEKEIPAEKPKKQAEPVVSISDQVLASKARDLLDGILQRMSLECKVTLHETPEKIILDIEGDNSSLLIGKRGQNIDALQYILNKAIKKFNTEHKMILIESGEYRKKREEFLLSLAEKIREKVKNTMKPVSLAHMNAHDRRIIHMALQEDKSLATQSRGEGRYRKVVVLPAKTGNNRHIREKKKD